MSVSNALTFPETEERFEEMCFNLYRREWRDPSSSRLGGKGQGQFGLDILGRDGARTVGVQCKHYVKTPFTLSTVQADIRKADEAGLVLDHLIFATTAANSSKLVLKVKNLSDSRGKARLFTVSVAFWEELSALLRLHSDVAREYIPGFAGSTLLQVQQTTQEVLIAVQDGEARNVGFQSTVLGQLSAIHGMLAVHARDLPDAQGGEAEPLIARTLDMVRERLLAARPTDALDLLRGLGNPAKFKDKFSQFRWHTNRAAAVLLEGDKKEAAREYFAAAAIDPSLEKAWSNTAHAHLLGENHQAALAASNEGLQKFPESAVLWALRVAARALAGIAAPEQDVPAHIRVSSDVAFTLSHIRYKQGRLEESFDVLGPCVATETPSLETRRSYLAAALSWATANPVLAHRGQLLPKQSQALRDALRRLEPLETTLGALQSDSVSLELTNNVSVALLLVGQNERAHAITAVALARHPLSEGLLRIRVNDLDSKGDGAGIRRLTEGRLHELPDSTLAALAEISANRGDLVWHEEVLSALNPRALSDGQRADINVLRVHALWTSGNRSGAVAAAKQLVAEPPHLVLARVMLSRMLEESGDLDAAADCAAAALQQLGSDSPTAHIAYLADLMYDRADYKEAADLYGRMIVSLGANTLSYRYLECLVSSGQRRKAQDALHQLSGEDRNSPIYRRIASNLARQTGEWAEMRDLLKPELERVPEDSGIALGYVGALHRIRGEEATLKEYLATDPSYDGKAPLNEVEIAKYQATHGLQGLALRRLYRLYRRRSTEASYAGFYLAPILIGKKIEEMDPPTSAGPGVAVELKGDSEMRTVAIDIDETSEGSGWPELVSSNSKIARTLRGSTVGQPVVLERGAGAVAYEVVGLSSLFSFAAIKAHELLATTASPGGPLFSLNLGSPDGSLNIKPLLEMARRRAARVTDAFMQYTQLRLPLATLAQLLGSDPLTLILDWPSATTPLFVSAGDHEERESALQTLSAGTSRYVLDLPTIGELVRSGVFREVAPLLNRPLIPGTVREQLTTLLDFQERVPTGMSLREETRGLLRGEITEDQLTRRLVLLREMLAFIDQGCEVVPVTGPAEVEQSHRDLALGLDKATLDAVYLSLERHAVLLAEDGGLRLFTQHVGLEKKMGLQPVYLFALQKGAISQEKYVSVLMDKVARNHDFLTIRGEDLVVGARSNLLQITRDVRNALETIRKPTLELSSGLRVCCNFVREIIPLLPAFLSIQYCELTLAVLEEKRSSESDVIRKSLGAAMRSAIDTLPKRKRSEVKRNWKWRSFLSGLSRHH